LALEEFKHVVIGDWVAGFSLVEGAALVLGGRGRFLDHLGLLLNHDGLAWMASILLLISVHATSSL
jgi:hypothetical protein